MRLKSAPRRRAVLMAMLACLAILCAPPAMAQAWPVKLLRIIVVCPPGDVSDATARAIGEKLAVLLGTRVVIKNRAGADGTIGIFALAKTPATVIARLNADINKLLQMPEIRQRFLEADNIPTGGSPADFARQIAIDSDNNARIIKAANIKAE